MKHILLLIAIMITTGHSAFAQKPDTIPQRERVQQEKREFIDEDGDGLPDRSQQQEKKRMKRDQFIDKNGDGICDSREQGLGFQRMRKQQSDQTGKQTRRGKK